MADKAHAITNRSYSPDSTSFAWIVSLYFLSSTTAMLERANAATTMDSKGAAGRKSEIGTRRQTCYLVEFLSVPAKSAMALCALRFHPQPENVIHLSRSFESYFTLPVLALVMSDVTPPRGCVASRQGICCLFPFAVRKCLHIAR